MYRPAITFENPKLINLSWSDIESLATQTAASISEHLNSPARQVMMYPIPRGGVFAAQAVKAAFGEQGTRNAVITDDPLVANVIIDDIIDSGNTRKRFFDEYAHQKEDPAWVFVALIDKTNGKREKGNTWYSFPWERMMKDDGPVDNVRRLIEFIGDDPERDGLKKTPERVVKSYQELYGGYGMNLECIFSAVFPSKVDEMVIVENIDFVSFCEHHMLPFTGVVHIGYVPDGKVLGLSKFARVVECFARRLQIQEGLTEQIADAIDNHLKPKGVGVVVRANHSCMSCRGVKKQRAGMVTSSLRGVFRDKPEARAEFLNLVHNGR